MKMLILLCSVMSFGFYAISSDKPLSTGSVSIYNSARSYEVVIDGPAAEKIFNTLEADLTQVGQWLNKNVGSIICGQNLKTKEFSCSFSIDENGIQQ